MSANRNNSAAKRARAAEEPSRVAAAFRAATLIRAADEAALELAQAGRTGLVVRASGLEVLLAGTAAAMEPRDWALPGVRQSPIALARGLRPVSWFAQLLGRIADPSRGRQEPYHPAVRNLNLFSVSTSAGSQLVQAAGVARAMARAGRGEAAVALCGGAACATAGFHEGLNFAAVWRAPAVFVVTSGEALARQTASRDVAVKAEAYGIPAVKVDGGDLESVLSTVEEALSRARAGKGPTLIDASCPEKEPAAALVAGPRLVEKPGRERGRRDPLSRAASLVADAEAVASAVRAEVEVAVAAALALPPPPGELLFQDVFERRTPELDRQRRAWLRARGRERS